MRAGLGARPLDGRTRAAYASLLVEVADDDNLAAAAFQARRAAELAPVTVPVVRVATLVLARAGDLDRALTLTRGMFAYDPGQASGLLAEIEPVLADRSPAEGLPDLPDAWLAWSRQLSRAGRGDEAAAWVDRGLARWPRDAGLRENAAGRAVAGGHWAALSKLLPDDEALPDDPSSSPLLAYRARGRATRGDSAGAIADARRAATLAAGRPWDLTRAGDAIAAVGDPDGAIGAWRQALHRLPSRDAGPGSLRISLLERIARTDDRRGHAGDALRGWRAILAIAPEHDEARRRVTALGGTVP